MSNSPIIVGAGLAGLIAAHAWPSFPLIDAAPGPAPMHKAVLRFRTDAVARLTGIEFRKVRVRKGIWSGAKFTPPDIRNANLYSQKVLGKLVGERSIWNLDAADRFIAPDTFYEEMIGAVGSRVQWATSAEFARPGVKISTAPLPLTMEALGVRAIEPAEFGRAGIIVVRGTIPGADVFQTIYFTSPGTPMYRASITGSSMIIEAVDRGASDAGWLEPALQHVQAAFGLAPGSLRIEEQAKQRYGKIAPVSDHIRKAAMFSLTHDHNVFSLGRFATWRNILLDDVVDDIAVIKRLMRASDYDLRRAMQRG